jgi:alpha-glucosidase
MAFTFVDARNFTPALQRWTPVGNISGVTRNGNAFQLAMASGSRSLVISFLSDTCFRVRFNPAPNADYSIELSRAVVNRNLGTPTINIVQNDALALIVDTSAMRVQVDLQPYRVQVFRGTQLVSADEPTYNLLYIPNELVIANFKTRPGNSHFYGFGEKAGEQVDKAQFTMTNFNFDNFEYGVESSVPSGTWPGPLNPSVPLYCSIPLAIEINPSPTGAFAGAPIYSGVYFDNHAQTYFNMGSNDYSNYMGDKWYFGALYNDLDYYFMLGDRVVDVLNAYTTLTGRSPMPPKYIFGYHQGGYGYYDRALLEGVAHSFRNAHIPCDGLHIDVDFQDNYRTFTHSEKKFPLAATQMFPGLRALGFKSSTNITPMLRSDGLDENGAYSPYAQRQALLAMGGLIYNTRAGQGPNSSLFEGNVSYGDNNGFNPFNQTNALGATGNYPDFGRADVRTTWGQQYDHLINDLGMEMIWQDMTCPAMADSSGDFKTFPLNLMINDSVNYVPNAVAHNSYVLNLLDATWNGINALRPAIRNFIIARGGFAGMQRYAGLWTGDSGSSWEFLRANLPEVLNLGMSGVPISGCDIGGFGGNRGDSGMVFFGPGPRDSVCNYELLTRWMHLGSFLPWYRNHYNGYTKAFQEPYRYGEPVPTNCRKYIELRYRMLQIYYDAMYEWTQSGMPIARALFLNDPQDPQVYNHLNDQFFVGHDFLVAPMVRQFETLPNPQPPLRDIYLPAGSDWCAFHEGKPLEAIVPGGTLVSNYFAGLDLVPIYIRAGAILPMRSLVEQYVSELPENPLEIYVYPGADSTYMMYQDDGRTTNAAHNGDFRTTQIDQTWTSRQTTVKLTRQHDQFAPPEAFYTIRLMQPSQPTSVTAGGVALADVGSAGALAASAINAFYWDAQAGSTLIKIFDIAAAMIIVAQF